MRKILFVLLFAMLLTLTGCGSNVKVVHEPITAKYLVGTWTSIGREEVVGDDVVFRSDDRKVVLNVTSETEASIEVTEANDKFQEYKAIFHFENDSEEEYNDFDFTHEEVNAEGEKEVIEESGFYKYYPYVKVYMDAEDVNGPVINLCLEGDSYNCFVLTKNK